MKKQLTAILMTMSILGIAQGPVIEGTYLPVRNTSIRQVWDKTPGSVAIPSVGTNMVWDYRISNGQFTNIVDTFKITMLDPAQTPYGQYYPTATHAAFIRTPYNNVSDSLFQYFRIDYDGIHTVGRFSEKKEYDSTQTNIRPEFYAPPAMPLGYSKNDTATYIAYANNYNYLGYKAKVKGRKIKNFTYVGYGTLRLPSGDYNDVALIKETYSIRDSIFIDYPPVDGNYVYFGPPQTSSGVIYEFFRNNTFGSSYLAYLSANPSNTTVDYSWFTLPIDFGSISGSVFTSTAETTPITTGEAYLYRENSNFTKNDILAKAQVNALGQFKFDSIPFGEYRIAIRPNATLYPNAQITYYGDSTDWLQAPVIVTTNSISAGHKIHIKFNAAPVGVNAIHGTLLLDLGIAKGSGVHASNPIPGIGVVIKRNPGSSSSRVVVTDGNGEFNTGTLDDGAYTLFVDIPGMQMTGTYSFNVSGTSSVTGLDFTAGTDSIHPSNMAIGIREVKNSKGGSLSAYPNPYAFNSTIVLSMLQADDMKLEVYDLLGAKVATLDKGSKQAGTYTYNFSAKKLNYSSGIYFVKVTIGNKTDVIKIIEQ